MFKAHRIIMLVVIFSILSLLSFYVYAMQEDDLRLISPFALPLNTENISMQEEVEDTRDYTVTMADYPDYEVMHQNEDFILYLDASTYNIALYDKASSYAWFSTDPNYDGVDVVTGRNHNSQTQNRIRSSVYFRTTQIDTISSDRHLLNEARNVIIESIQNGFIMKIDLLQARISFDIVVTLDEKGLVFEIPFESITEDDIRLQSIRVFPGLGMTTGIDMTGYLFIPDGSGALIRYNNPTIGTSYTASVYGDDHGYTTLSQPSNRLSNVLSAYQVKHPVLGIVHGVQKQALFAHIESGAEAAQIRAEVRNNVTKYFTNSYNFQYRQLYFKPTNNQGAGYRITSATMAPIEARVRYYTLSGDDADYVGMATKYRSILEENMIAHSTATDQIPMHLNILSTEVKKAIIGTKYVTLTDYEDIENMIDDLKQMGINQLSLSLIGKNKDGSYQLGHTRQMGSQRDFKSLITYLDQQDIPLYFNYELNYMYQTNQHIAKQMGGNIISIGTYSSIFSSNYLLDMIDMKRHHEHVLDVLDKHDVHIDFSHSVQLAYSHYDSQRNIVYRDDMIDEIKDYMEDYSVANRQIMMRNPNAYAAPYATQMIDIPVQVSGYQFITDAVPFVQIAFRSLVDLYSSPLNFIANRQVYLLKMIEYGMYPSYALTEADTFLLRDTDNTTHYTTEFRRWKDEIQDEYAFLNHALKHVTGKKIVDHTYLGQNLVSVTYEQGITILVNYNDYQVTYNTYSIPRMGYYVIGGHEDANDDI